MWRLGGARIIAFLNKADWIYEQIEELGEVQFCLQETSCAKESCYGLLYTLCYINFIRLLEKESLKMLVVIDLYSLI